MPGFTHMLGKLAYIPRKSACHFEGGFLGVLSRIEQDVHTTLLPAIQKDGIEGLKSGLEQLNHPMKVSVLDATAFAEKYNTDRWLAVHNPVQRQLDFKTQFDPQLGLHEGVHAIQNKHALDGHHGSWVQPNANTVLHEYRDIYRIPRGSWYTSAGDNPNENIASIMTTPTSEELNWQKDVYSNGTWDPASISEQLFKELQAHGIDSANAHKMTDLTVTTEQRAERLNLTENAFNSYALAIRQWNNLLGLTDETQRSAWFKEKLKAVDQKSDRFKREGTYHAIFNE
jgi:hypothetical protein